MSNIPKNVAAYLLGVSIMTGGGIANADVNVTNYPLGISPKTLHDKLVADRFVFEKFSDKEIRAVKKVVTGAETQTEYPDIAQSTTLTAWICAGKVFRIRMTSVYGGDRNALLMGRKSFYSYLKNNKAVNDAINLHKGKGNPQVVLGFSIDRSGQTNKEVRGTEMAKLALGTSSTLSSTLKEGTEPLLEMSYSLENKWFCPK